MFRSYSEEENRYWYNNFNRDPYDYRKHDIVSYKGRITEVYHRNFDSVDIDEGELGISRFSNEIKIVVRAEDRMDIEYIKKDYQ